MPDNNEPSFPPCHVSPQSAPCRCCSDHRQIIQQLRRQLNAAQAMPEPRQSELMDEDEKAPDPYTEIMKRRKEENKCKKEVRTRTLIKIARDEDIRKQIGKDMYLDLVNYDKVRSFKFREQLPFILFKVGTLREVSKKLQNEGLFLFLEVELGPDLSPLPPPNKSRDGILIFFKLYDAEKEELRYVGKMFVKAVGKPLEILAKLNELAGFPENEEIDLFKEIEFAPDFVLFYCPEFDFEPNIQFGPIDKRISFSTLRYKNGDIICFQKAIVSQCETNYRYPDVPSFLKYVHNRQVVHFRQLKNPEEDAFSLELSKRHTYDDVVERVARHIKVDDTSKICFTAHGWRQQPRDHLIRYRDPKRLAGMLRSSEENILYYEVLDIPLPELQGLKTLNVIFHHPTKDEVVSHRITLPNNSTVGDVIIKLKSQSVRREMLTQDRNAYPCHKQVELSHPYAELRLLMICNHQIYKIFFPFEKMEKINDKDFTEHKNDLYRTLRAEEIPEEDANPGPQDRLIHVYHIRNDPNRNQVQNFGEPFLLVIHQGETLAEVKKRIQERLEVHDEEFAKWKFAFVYMSRPEYLKDSDDISSFFQRTEIVYGVWEQYLGLEHTDTHYLKKTRFGALTRIQ